MTQIHDFGLSVHRHRDGSIDIDYYRARSIAMRGAAMRDTRILKAFMQFIAIATFAIVGTIIIVSAPAPVINASCKQCPSPLVQAEAAPAVIRIASSLRGLR